MTQLANFRNVIVHDHARIDPEIVDGILHKHLVDFKRFSKEIIHYLEKL